MRYRLQRHDGTDCSATMVPFTVLRMVPIQRYRHQLSAIRVEQTYKGNFHLLANVDGIERKFVIARNKEEYAYIENTGILNLSEEYLAMLIKKYLLH